jgi:hypothetical protein
MNGWSIGRLRISSEAAQSAFGILKMLKGVGIGETADSLGLAESWTKQANLTRREARPGSLETVGLPALSKMIKVFRNLSIC